MSADKIKHFYMTFVVALVSLFFLLVFYGCYTYRK